MFFDQSSCSLYRNAHRVVQAVIEGFLHNDAHSEIERNLQKSLLSQNCADISLKAFLEETLSNIRSHRNKAKEVYGHSIREDHRATYLSFLEFTAKHMEFLADELESSSYKEDDNEDYNEDDCASEICKMAIFKEMQSITASIQADIQDIKDNNPINLIREVEKVLKGPEPFSYETPAIKAIKVWAESQTSTSLMDLLMVFDEKLNKSVPNQKIFNMVAPVLDEIRARIKSYSQIAKEQQAREIQQLKIDVPFMIEQKNLGEAAECLANWFEKYRSNPTLSVLCSYNENLEPTRRHEKFLEQAQELWNTLWPHAQKAQSLYKKGSEAFREILNQSLESSVSRNSRFSTESFSLFRKVSVLLQQIEKEIENDPLQNKGVLFPEIRDLHAAVQFYAEICSMEANELQKEENAFQKENIPVNIIPVNTVPVNNILRPTPSRPRGPIVFSWGEPEKTVAHDGSSLSLSPQKKTPL